MSSSLDLLEILEQATHHALTIAESGPLTERSPRLRRSSRPEVRASGTFRVGLLTGEAAVQGYLLMEARQKEAAAADIFLAALSLRQLRCPGELIRRVDRAVQDKARHAEALFAAAGCGHITQVGGSGEQALTDLVGLAFDIATQRCVADTYAAARFAYQAECAEALELRSVFLDIARDDAIHSALFWELLGWALSHLSPARGRRIKEEQSLVRGALREAIEAPLDEALHVYAGVPEAEAGHAIMDTLEFQLWSEAAA